MNGQQQHVQLAVLPAGSSSLSSAQSSTAEAPVADMCPALYRAVRKGRIKDVMALLLRQHGAAASDAQAMGITRQHVRCDVMESSPEGNTVLHLAAEHGHGELIQELCLRFNDKAEALLRRRNSALDTPLHCAARSGGKTVKTLVQLCRSEGRVVVLGFKNGAGDTALHCAARHGHDKAVEALVTAAPAVAAELNGAGVSPMYLAVISGSVKSLKHIVLHCGEASCAGPSSQNALHAAVFQSKEMVELLLQWRPYLAAQVDCNGNTPLHFASSDGDLSIVRAILRTAPPRTVYKRDDSGGLSALHVAAVMGHDRVVGELIRSCPDAAELRDDGGRTFLHAAAKAKHSSVMLLVIKNKHCTFLLNSQDKEGNTPLHIAVSVGAPKVVEALLWKGKVRADVLNNVGHTALDLVAESTSYGYATMVSLVVMLVAFKAQCRPQRQDHLKPWKCTDLMQGIEKASDSLTVVAVLIAAAAFAAGFNLPGGYSDDGTPNLKGKLTFKYFLVLDTIAAGTSVAAAILLVYGKASCSMGSWKSFVASLQCLWVSLMSLLLAFYAALVATMSTESTVCYAMVTAIYIFIQFLILWIMPWMAPVGKSSFTNWRFLWQRSKGRHVIERQYPLASASIPNLSLFRMINLITLVGFLFLHHRSLSHP